jgi:hypothetical protein
VLLPRPHPRDTAGMSMPATGSRREVEAPA